MTDFQKDIVLALAENNMRVKQSAEQLKRHWNVIHYQIDKIYELTGLDPKNFYDLCKLVEIVKKGE